jgi:predicted RNA binding protein YcfA (HicA-like mRNA interferase family)
LQKVDFYVDRQKGSHIVMLRDAPYAKVVVPDHKEVDKGTLRGILRQAGLTVDEFLALL